MAESGLFGSYPLTTEKINEVVTGVGPGAYALGYDSSDGKSFYIQRVGRSDTNLNKRLHDHVGNYKRFKYGYANTIEDAYYAECRLYHDFNPPDNFIHPDAPDGTNLSCHVCGQ